MDMTWKDCGQTGFITFTHIRSSVSTQVITIFYLNLDMAGGNLEDFQIMLHICLPLDLQAKHHLSEKDRRQVARAMCHNSSTAEKFCGTTGQTDCIQHLQTLDEGTERCPGKIFTVQRCV